LGSYGSRPHRRASPIPFSKCYYCFCVWQMSGAVLTNACRENYDARTQARKPSGSCSARFAGTLARLKPPGCFAGAPEPSWNLVTSATSTATLNASRTSRLSSTRPGGQSRCQPPALQKNSQPKLAFSSCRLTWLGHGRLAIALREHLKLVPQGRGMGRNDMRHRGA
jgi:hypothetical protein